MLRSHLLIIVDDDGQEHELDRPLRDIERETVTTGFPPRRQP
jgi:hypothetical protein